jgi:recombination protein RecA
MVKKRLEQASQESSQSQEILKSLKDYLDVDTDDEMGPSWYLDTGNYALNYIVSGDPKKGWPGGMISELFGDPSTGKTLLILKACAEMQAAGGQVVVFDAEGRWDSSFAKLHGVNTDLVARSVPETIEEFATSLGKVLDGVLEMKPRPRVLMCLDSLAILSTLDEMKTMGKTEDMGRRAKRIKALMRAARTRIRDTQAIFLVSNHIIANPNPFQTPYTTTGGKGVFFQASVRIEMGRPKKITVKDKDRPMGVTLNCKCTKNSLTPPFGECEMDLYWSKGVSRCSGLEGMMKDLDIINRVPDGGLENYVLAHPEILSDAKWANPYFKEV